MDHQAEDSTLNSQSFCLNVSQAEGLTKTDDRAPLTRPSSSHQSLLSAPVLPEVPVISGVEESQSDTGDQEDKEELEFPHDLLPSLDFSSELNIWESSLGWVQPWRQWWSHSFSYQSSTWQNGSQSWQKYKHTKLR